MAVWILTPTQVLENLKGKKLSKELLLGRGYWEVLNNNISYVKEIGFDPSEIAENTNITSVNVKKYLSCNTPFYRWMTW